MTPPLSPSPAARRPSGPGGLRLLAVVCAAALSFAGCATMAPPYEPPPLPVPAAYPGVTPVETAKGWSLYFTDPRLQSVIALALANNRDLRIALHRVEEARATYGIQRADRFPTIAANADGSRSRVPGDLSLTGEPVTASQYQVGLGLSTWELDFWGRVRSLKDAALENFLATDASRRAVTISLIAQVANSYLTLLELDERLELARQTIESRAESLRIFRRRVEVGSTSKLDLVQVETLWLQAKTLRTQLAQARALQLNALTLLVGAPPDIGAAVEPFDDLGMLPAVSVGLPSELLLDRPDIIAAEHQLKAANANIGAARAAFFPRIALTASFGTASAELDGLFGGGSRAWSFAPGISLPLFDGGRNRGNLDLAEARRNRAVAEYEKTIQGAFRDVADALASRQWLTEQVRTLQDTVTVQTERARLAKLRYDHGAISFLEVLDAQRDLLSVAQERVQARRALLSSRVDLYTALGGGARALPVQTVAAATRSAN